MTDSSRFWDRIAERYAAKPVPDEAVYQRKLAVTRQYLQPHMQVLEFGCGSGLTALRHADHARHIHGIDSSGRLIEIARRNAAAAGVANVSFDRRSIEDYVAPPASFDVVLGLSVLHLVDGWRDAITKIHTLLKPGGVFVSSTACLRGRWLLHAFFPLAARLGVVPKVSFIGDEQLVEAHSKAGFTVEHQWEPDGGRTVFLVARKPEQ